MELPGELSPDKDRQDIKGSVTCSERSEIESSVNLATVTTISSAVTQATTSISGTSTGGHSLLKHTSSLAQQHHASITSMQQSIQLAAASSLLPQSSIGEMGSSSSLYQSHHNISTGQQNLEKLSRPAAFDKMESLVREMQDPEHGVPVRQQKMFLTSIPYAFMGYDLIEWLMDRLLIEESEALNIANQLCLHGYFFPVNDTKLLTVKDDSSLYRFQTPYYWPWQHKPPDNVEYAIYLVKRSMRNKQRHALEDYELEALASLHKNLKGKWEIIKMQAEEQVRLAKERKKGDKIVGDSQERAYWRVYRPPPGQFTPLEPAPVPSRDRQGTKQNKKKLIEDLEREIDYLRKSLTRTRIKMSQACESLVLYSETFAEYDFFLQPVLPSNPWVTEDITFWQLNNKFVDVPTEKRVKRWAISIEELVSDPTGLQEFTAFLEKEYSHENIRFWIAVNRLRRSAHSQVSRKVQEIYEEFLKPGAPCEINIDGKTMETVLKGLKHPSRFTFDAASEHIYTLLLKKDCYPRFIRSDHYKRLLETGIQPAHKKRFFNFGGVGGAKKKITATPSSQGIMGANDGNKTICNMGAAIVMQTPNPGNLPRRRSSDRSLSGSAHELTAIDVSKDATTKVPHSHSQSNLSEIPFGEPQKSLSTRLDSVNNSEITNSAICPWDVSDETVKLSTPTGKTSIQLSICPWEQNTEISSNMSRGTVQRLTSTSSDNSEINERTQRNLVMRHQHTVDSGDTAGKRLMPHVIEPRRASVSFTPGRITEFPMGLSPTSTKGATTPSPTVSTTHMAKYSALFKPLQVAQSATAVAAILGNVASTGASITKDPPSNSDTEMEELSKLSISERSESSSSELPVLPTTAPAPTPQLLTKVTPPPPPPFDEVDETLEISVESQPNATAEIKYIISPNSSPQDDATTNETSINERQSLETEVDVKIDEVQIELIETNISDYKKLCEGEDPSVLSTNTVTHIIHIEEDKKNTTPTLDVTDMEIVDEPISTNAKLKVKEYDNEKLQEEHEITNTETALKQSKEEITVEFYGCSEDLSPTTAEFRQTSQCGIDKAVYEYDVNVNETGYIPPAPTPAPIMAPLAEIDTDIVDDEASEETATSNRELSPLPTFKLPICSVTKYHNDEAKRKRKKKHVDSKKLSSMEEKVIEQINENEASTSSGMASKSSVDAKTETDIVTVCPWEDENISTSDGTFVKTYATLGYL